MNLTLSTVITLGKSLAIKREKGDDDTEVTRAHLKFSELFLTREQVDVLCDETDGWCAESFFDDMGAPRHRRTLKLDGDEFSLVGSITSPDGEGLTFTEATVDGIELTMTKLGAAVSGQVVWLVAGDEAGDAEPLLGRICRADWTLRDSEQERLPLGAAA